MLRGTAACRRRASFAVRIHIHRCFQAHRKFDLYAALLPLALYFMVLLLCNMATCSFGMSWRRWALCKDVSSCAGSHTDEIIPQLMARLARALFTTPARTKRFEWCNAFYQNRGEQAVAAFLAFCDSDQAPEEAAAALGVADSEHSKAQRALLVCVRGLLGSGVLFHCLSLRHRVDYGINFGCALVGK